MNPSILAAVPRFSLETLPVTLLIVLIIVLFAALLWFILSKLPGEVGVWAKWVAIAVGGILLLWFLISLLPGSAASAQTTQPTRQVTVSVTRAGITKQVNVVLAAEVADRLDSNLLTAQDTLAINDAVEIEFGHVGEPIANPCHKPTSNLINEGRLPTNCSDNLEPRKK